MNKINEKRKSLINIGSATVYIEIFVLSAILLGASLFFLKDYDATTVSFVPRARSSIMNEVFKDGYNALVFNGGGWELMR